MGFVLCLFIFVLVTKRIASHQLESAEDINSILNKLIQLVNATSEEDGSELSSSTRIPVQKEAGTGNNSDIYYIKTKVKPRIINKIKDNLIPDVQQPNEIARNGKRYQVLSEDRIIPGVPTGFNSNARHQSKSGAHREKDLSQKESTEHLSPNDHTLRTPIRVIHDNPNHNDGKQSLTEFEKPKAPQNSPKAPVQLQNQVAPIDLKHNNHANGGTLDEFKQQRILLEMILEKLKNGNPHGHSEDILPQKTLSYPNAPNNIYSNKVNEIAVPASYLQNIQLNDARHNWPQYRQAPMPCNTCHLPKPVLLTRRTFIPPFVNRNVPRYIYRPHLPVYYG